MLYERKDEPLLPRRRFYARMLRHVALAGAILGLSLGLGVLGYRTLAHLGWVDALLNAAMILTGMGPVTPMQSDAAKLFAAAYALFSGVVFLTSVGIMVTPAVHRILHRFHLEDEGAA